MGNVSWDSKCPTHKTRIVDLCRASSNELVGPNAPVQNWIVLIDSALYPQWSEPRDTARRGGQADSRGGRDFKHKTIKENSEEI